MLISCIVSAKPLLLEVRQQEERPGPLPATAIIIISSSSCIIMFSSSSSTISSSSSSSSSTSSRSRPAPLTGRDRVAVGRDVRGHA